MSIILLTYIFHELDMVQFYIQVTFFDISEYWASPNCSTSHPKLHKKSLHKFMVFFRNVCENILEMPNMRLEFVTGNLKKFQKWHYMNFARQRQLRAYYVQQKVVPLHLFNLIFKQNMESHLQPSLAFIDGKRITTPGGASNTWVEANL